ncbi:MAG: Acg family FMN-binding oxidoreductase [Aquabacterium sp.]
MLQRRSFIRVLGGGAVLAATAGATGCSSAYPTEAVAPWAGPGTEPDLRRWALGFAILAPNSHNRQPWLVDLREPDALTLYVDRERLLPETDPWFRQIVVSQGTFIESLVIALRERGVVPQVQLFPQGEFAPRTLDDRPVARIHWTPAAAGATRDPLFAQLLRRHTAKVPYDTSRPVAPAVLAQLAGVVGDEQVRFGGTVDAAALVPLRELCWQSAQTELTTERTVMESIRLTRVGPAEIARHRDGIAINGLFPRALTAVGLFDRTRPPEPGSGAYKNMMGRFEGQSLSAMGFVWLSTRFADDAAAGRSRSAEVRAGRAYMRLQLKATELGLQMHPMSQAPQEFAEMAPHRARLQQLTLGRPADAEVVQMFCRIGHADDQPHTPRRGVDAIIRA